MNLEEFDPRAIPYQYRVIEDVRCRFDYDLGTHEILLSGSVGSSKTTLMSHILATHAIENPMAQVMIGREALPDLRDTLYKTILEQFDGLGVMQKSSDRECYIRLINGSEIFARTWHDKRFKKFRSLALSAVGIEELTENRDQVFYDEIKMRVGRCPHVREKIIVCATNPDSPQHWAHKYFIQGSKENQKIHVYYSRTYENPFLDKTYIEGIRETLDAKMCQRMLEGKWLAIETDIVYYAYSPDWNTVEGYKINPHLPLMLTFDFNIAMGKPMSAAACQYVGGRFYFFREFVVEGARTADLMEEMEDLLSIRFPEVIVFGDETGKNRDTRSIRSDYDIIMTHLKNHKTGHRARLLLPSKNPPIRARHNCVNGALKNDLGQTTLFIDSKCKVAHEGMALTSLKKGGDYIEDDSKSYQHITTAIGYLVHYVRTYGTESRSGTIRL